MFTFRRRLDKENLVIMANGHRTSVPVLLCRGKGGGSLKNGGEAGRFSLRLKVMRVRHVTGAPSWSLGLYPTETRTGELNFAPRGSVGASARPTMSADNGDRNAALPSPARVPFTTPEDAPPGSGFWEYHSAGTRARGRLSSHIGVLNQVSVAPFRASGLGLAEFVWLLHPR